MNHRKFSAFVAFVLSIFGVSSAWPQSTQSAQNSPSDSLQPDPATTGKEHLLLKDGTPVRLFLMDELSSAKATVGQRVTFQTIYPVVVKGVVVIPQGGIGWGTVRSVRRKGLMARGGKLDIEINAVRLADGETASLRAVERARGKTHSDGMKRELEATALVFYPAAPLALLTKGDDITLPKGIDVTAYVNGDLLLDLARFDPDYDSEIPEVADFRLLSIVQIRSTPDDAEIIVDGKYDGVAPSVVRLASGDHKIEIRKDGFKTWERTITLSPGGSQFISAKLQAQ
jgi:hypothetical protein